MKPPAWARAFARLTCAREDIPFVIHDLDRRFDEEAARSGSAAARRWYVWQVMRGLAWRVRPGVPVVSIQNSTGTGGDLRLAVRALTRRPMYAIGVVGTLALGLASAAIISAVAWHVWLSPMPFPDPERVVRFYETEPVEPFSSAGDASTVGAATLGDEAEGRRWRIAPPLLEDLRANDWSSIAAVAGISQDAFDWLDGGETRRVSSLKVSPEAFDILGVTPTAGRLLTEDDAFAVLLTEPFWERAFGSDPGVIGGQSLSLDGIERVVVGVVGMPAGYPDETDIVSLLRFNEGQLTEGMRGARYLDVIGRVRPGRSLADAEAEAEAFLSALGAQHPQHAGWGADVVNLGDNLVASYRGVLTLLLSAGLAFLLLAVINVGGLVAARRADAHQDRAVRLALGASEYRLLRLSVVESILLGSAGGVAALMLARWTLPPLRALLPADVPRLSDVALTTGLGGGVVAVGLVVGGAVGVLGYILSRGDGPSISGRRGTTAPGLRGRQYLVAGQVALTTLLTTGGFTILRHVSELKGIDVGFDPQGVWSSPSVLSEARYPDDDAKREVWRSIEEGLESRGMLAAVGVNTPMSGSNMPFGFRRDETYDQAFAQYHTVSDAYFETLGIAVLDGRTFGPQDRASGAPVVVVNEALAREHFPEGGVVGRELRLLEDVKNVIGVVASARHFGPDEEAPPEIYVPLQEDPWALGTVLFRSDRGDAASVLAQIVDDIDPSLGVPPPRPYAEHLDAWYAPLRLQLVMVGALAVLGLTLASFGLYALVAYHVSTRRREIGIRIALGAPSDQVIRSILSTGGVLTATGGAIGMVGWYLLAPRARSWVEGIDPTDPFVPMLVTLVVGAVCFLATLGPAWRASSVDPVTTLSAE